MARGTIGQFQITSTGEESVHAFVLYPFPPNPLLQMDGALNQALAEAMLSLSRLDGIPSLLPDSARLIYAYVRKEAALSSQIEGTQLSLSDILLYEMEETPWSPIDDEVEVSNHIATMEHVTKHSNDDYHLSKRLIHEIQGKLLSRVLGSSKTTNKPCYGRSHGCFMEGRLLPKTTTFISERSNARSPLVRGCCLVSIEMTKAKKFNNISTMYNSSYQKTSCLTKACTFKIYSLENMEQK